jgi:choline dehydrogenase-like flavoprotein
MTELPTSAATVVVGSGPAGCALAGRLAAAGEDVLLLEAGPDYGPEGDGGWPEDLLDASALPASHGWDYTSGTTYPGREVAFERARVIGGCSSHNGCAAIWGSRRDYDDWAAAGAPLWSADRIAPLLAEAERALRVRRYRDDEVTPFQQACIEAALAAGIPYADDLNDLDEDEGIGLAPVNIADGVRWNAAFAFVDGERDGRLRVAGDALVAQVALDGDRAAGVVVARQGRLERVEAERVVLAAGSYGSPAVLQRSGIGDAASLARVGIDCRHELPGVGRNLHDHPMAVLRFAGSDELVRRWRERPGWLPEEQTIAKLRSPLCSDAFDLHLNPIGGPLADPPGGWRWELPVSCMTPRSRGALHVVGDDPEAAPVIDHRYLADDHDARVLVAGLRIAREVAAASPLAELLGPELEPGPEVRSDADLRRFAHATVVHYFHPVGTCRMGLAEDPRAVVDQHGAVHGIDGLHVADCSIIPTIPRANTNLPAAAIGLHLADLLLASEARSTAA